MDKQVLKNRIEAAYYRVFPKSYISITNGALGGGLYIKCYLQKPSQWANNISHNDPLNYMSDIDPETMLYSEHNHSLTVKPDNKYMAYGSAKLRRRTIKKADIKKIEARFNQLKQFVIDNLDNAAHDIAGKVQP